MANDIIQEWGKDPEVIKSDIKTDENYKNLPSLDEDEDEGFESLGQMVTDEIKTENENEEKEKERLKALLEGAVRLITPHLATLLQGVFKKEHEIIVFTKDERIHLTDLEEYVRSGKKINEYQEHPFIGKLTDYQKNRLERKLNKSITYYDKGLPFNAEEKKHITVISEELTVLLFGWVAKLLAPNEGETTPLQLAVMALVVITVTRTAFSTAVWFDTKR